MLNKLHEDGGESLGHPNRQTPLKNWLLHMGLLTAE
jgi:hypothetical protein